MSASGAPTESQAGMDPRFLCPRYWPTWLAIGLLWWLSWMPNRFRWGLAQGLSALYRRLYAKRPRIVARNLELCYPDVPRQVRQTWLVRQFALQAYALLDLGRLWFRDAEFIRRHTDVSDVALLARMAEEGGVYLTGHSAGLEWIAQFITINRAGTAIYKPFGRNRLLNWFFERQRNRFGSKVYPRDAGLKPHISALRAGRPFFYIADEDLGVEHSVFAPFFGVDKATLPLAGRVAALGRAPVFPVLGQIDPVRGRYRLLVQPPVALPTTADEAAGAAINAALEALIADDPAQYMWSLKLFKTRPAGGVEIYD